jgi:hypothetical protein
MSLRSTGGTKVRHVPRGPTWGGVPKSESSATFQFQPWLEEYPITIWSYVIILIDLDFGAIRLGSAALESFRT